MPPPSDTQRHASHEASAQIQALIELAVEQQRDVLIITSQMGPTDRIIYANRAITAQTGYTPDEVIGRTPQMLHGPDTSPETLSRIRQAMEACEPHRAEVLTYRKDGSRFWAEQDIVPFVDNAGRATHIVTVQRDITARKAAQDVQRPEDQQFRQALEAGASAVWEWNLHTDALTFRDGLPDTSWHGQNHGRIDGQGLATFTALVHPEERTRVEQALLATLRGRDGLLVQDYNLRRPDDSYAAVSDRQVVLRRPDGTPDRVIASILDVGDQRKLEERRKQSQRLELLGEMTGGIAHNFNNLLTVILGNVNRLRDEEMDPDAVSNALRMIDEAAQQGASLTERLVSFSQSKKINLKPVDVRRLIDAMEPVWRNFLPPAIRLDVRHAADLWSVSTDEAHLEATILNLVINARDAMPDGGNLVISTENVAAGSPTLRAREGESESRFVTITIRDTGVGMPPGVARAAFDPFFTTKPPGKGTGLGLSSAYGFMRQSGGFLRLDSTPGVGTTLKIFLRVAADTPAPRPRGAAQQPAPDQGHRVLLVDDDGLVREFVGALLTSLNYTVTSATNGDEALAVLGSDQPVDLLFTDILMEGGVNGWQLAERARLLRPDLPILFTSAYPESVAAPASMAHEAIHVLRKPYRPRDLSAAVRAAIQRDVSSALET